MKPVTRDLPGQRLSVRGGNPGTGLGDRFKCFRGGSGLFEKGVQLAVEAAVLQGKDVAERPSRTTYPESPILHGKEGVNGSSPREGYRKFRLISFFRRLMRRQKRGAASTERPRAAAVFSYESAKSCC